MNMTRTTPLVVAALAALAVPGLARAHHGTAAVSVAGPEGPGAALETTSPLPLPQGTLFTMMKTEYVPFRKFAFAEPANKDTSSFNMFALGFGIRYALVRRREGHPERGEESAPHLPPAGDLELVVVQIDRRHRILVQDAARDPAAERLGGVGVFRVGDRLVARELDAHEVVRAARIEPLPLRLRDDVVGRTDEIGEVSRD